MEFEKIHRSFPQSFCIDKVENMQAEASYIVSSGNLQFAIEHGLVEIVSFPIQKVVIFHRYVNV